MTASDTIAALGNARYLNGRNQLCLAQGGFFFATCTARSLPWDAGPPPRRLWPMHMQAGGHCIRACPRPLTAAGGAEGARVRPGADSTRHAGKGGRYSRPLGAAARRPRRRPGSRKITRRRGSRSARGGPPIPPPVRPPSARLKGPMRTLRPIRSCGDLRKAPRSCGAPPRLPLRTARPPGRAAGRPGRIPGGHALATAHSSTFLNTPSLKRSVSGCV